MLTAIVFYTFAFPIALDQPKKEAANHSVVVYMRNLLAYEIQCLVLDLAFACLKGNENLFLSRSKALTSSIAAYLATPPGATLTIALDCRQRKDNPRLFDINSISRPVLRDKDMNPIDEVKYSRAKIKYDFDVTASAIEGSIAACKFVVSLSTINPRGGVDKFSFSPRRVVFIQPGVRRLIWFSILDHLKWFDRLHDTDLKSVPSRPVNPILR